MATKTMVGTMIFSDVSSRAIHRLMPVTRVSFHCFHVAHNRAARRSTSQRAHSRKSNVDEESEKERPNRNAFEDWLDKESSHNADSKNWVQLDKAKRKFYEKRTRRTYGTDSEDEKPKEDKYIELKPEIVEFKSLFAKQEELYFYDAFCFPWEKDKHYQMIRKLEQKYYPDQGLEQAFLDVDERSKPETEKPKSKSKSKIANAAEAEEKDSERTKRKQTDVGGSNEDNYKGNAFSVGSVFKRGQKPLPAVDLKSEDRENGLSQDKAHQFLKSLKNTPNFDGATDMPYLVTRKSELPARWDSPSGAVILIDKPKGWTSFTVCGKLRRLIKVQKIGHAGTLDPMATGLLIVCVGKATRQVQSFQDMVKVYSGVFRLGEATSTWDADSPVIEREPWEHIKDEDIHKAGRSFYGDIWQVPPMFSAIKVGGERMYDKARRGETIDLPPRRVSIYKFDVQRSLDDRQNLIFRVTCSKGTYVRSLCADFGRALGSCAHLASLRRDQIGDYSVADAWKFPELEDEIVKLYM